MWCSVARQVGIVVMLGTAIAAAQPPQGPADASPLGDAPASPGPSATTPLPAGQPASATASTVESAPPAAASRAARPSGSVKEPARALQSEPLLHPMDGFTAFTLRKGEFVYAQSPATLPAPSWAWWGVTAWLTAEIDLLPLLGGLLQDPYLPVPSFNFRFRLRDGGRSSISLAFETMVQHLWRPYDQEDFEHLRVTREGTSWFNRINASWPVIPTLHMHVSAGATYAHHIEFSNKDPVAPRGRIYESSISPDASLSIDWLVKPWLSLHAAGSYGTTFIYSDNQPRKLQVGYGFRIAPLWRQSWGFLRTLRFEFPALIIHYPDAGPGFRTLVPIIPYAYWQWGG